MAGAEERRVIGEAGPTTTLEGETGNREGRIGETGDGDGEGGDADSASCISALILKAKFGVGFEIR